ncbi:MAG: hypothetical protein GY856_08745 [bacterium]|nr:hypothetical protein [bacterium]
MELLFVERAVGSLIGLTTHLDPDFELWAATMPFAKRLASAGKGLGQGGALLEELIEQARSLMALPGRIDRLAARIQRGNLVVQITLGTDARRAFSRLERAVARLRWIVLAAALAVSGTFLYATEVHPDAGIGLMVLGGLSFLWSLTRRVG